MSCVTSAAEHAARSPSTRRIGFEPSEPQLGYDGPGEDRIVLTRAL